MLEFVLFFSLKENPMANEPVVHYVGFKPATTSSASSQTGLISPRLTNGADPSASSSLERAPDFSSDPAIAPNPLSSDHMEPERIPNLNLNDNPTANAPAIDTALPAPACSSVAPSPGAEGVAVPGDAHDDGGGGGGARVRPGVRELQAVVELRGAEAAARLRSEFGSAAALAALLGSGVPLLRTIFLPFQYMYETQGVAAKPD